MIQMMKTTITLHRFRIILVLHINLFLEIRSKKIAFPAQVSVLAALSTIVIVD